MSLSEHAQVWVEIWHDEVSVSFLILYIDKVNL